MSLWQADETLLLRLVLSALIAAALTAGIVVARAEWQWLKSRGELTREALRSMALSLSALPPNVLVTVLMTPVWHAIYATAGRFAVAEMPLTLLSIPIALAAADFSYYWEHRCAHRVAPLWALYHAYHHSADRYTVAVAYRVSFLNQLLAPAFYIPWIVLGIDPLLMIGMQLFVFHYQAWIHTELIGPLKGFDAWFNSPLNHRVHHSEASEHGLANLGGITLVWDRLFGTYVRAGGPIVYGIRGETAPATVLELYTKPWRRFVASWPRNAGS
jgi:sterol desaturase/sphingolipid hydroxylase (fatty acid hydroxylase superfamily)